MAGDPNIGSAALTITIDKAQVAAEAAAAIKPAIANAGAEASKALTSTAAGGAGIQKMIDQQKQLANEARNAANATAKAISEEAAAAEQAGGSVTTTGTRIRGLGAAATAVQGAFGGAAGEATRLASVLAYGGVAGATAIGISKLVEYGNSLNDTRLSMEQLKGLATKTTAEAAAVFGGFSTDDIRQQLNELVAQGPAGIGVIKGLRDEYVRTGRDTSLLDAALRDAAAAQDNLAASMARGTDTTFSWTRNIESAAVAADRAKTAAQQLAAAMNTQASAAAGLLTSQGSVVSAENRLRQAKEALANFGTEATGKSIREQRDEAAAVEAASQRIVDAQQSIIDARQKVADAQAKLAEAGVHEALAVNDAQDAVDAAQRKLNASTPEERAPAQHALDDAKQRLVDAKKALEQAKPDAERALADAVRGVDDAMRSEADAHRSLADAQDRQNESNQKAIKSQGDYQTAVDNVTEAQLALVQAQVDQRIKAEELATKLNVGPVEALGKMKQALRDVADELDPNSDLAQRIIYLLASMTPYAIEQTFGTAGSLGKVALRASGGDVFGGQIFRGAEQGPELLLRDGLYQAPPGGGRVVNARDTAAMLGAGPREVHHHVQNNYVTVQAVKEPAERAIRRELERYAALAGG